MGRDPAAELLGGIVDKGDRTRDLSRYVVSALNRAERGFQRCGQRWRKEARREFLGATHRRFHEQALEGITEETRFKELVDMEAARMYQALGVPF